MLYDVGHTCKNNTLRKNQPYLRRFEANRLMPIEAGYEKVKQSSGEL